MEANYELEETVTTSKSNKPKKHKALKIILCIFGGLILTLVLAWGGINIFKKVVYKDFYSRTNKINTIPGLNDGAVQQGITVNGDYIVMSTYMTKADQPSRIYILNRTTNASRYVEVYEDEGLLNPCTRHFGGIQYVSSLGKTYIADANKYVLEVDTETLMKEETKKIAIKNKYLVDNEASCIFSDDTHVYVAEFNKEGSNWTSNHKFTYENETHKALINVYDIKNTLGVKTVNFDEPSCYYSIGDLVQGVAFINNVLFTSTSWGLSNSHLYAYKVSDTVKLSEQYKNKDVFFVLSSKCVYNMLCPPMFEDLVLDNKTENDEVRIITYTESASNKYFFGKLFFADKIYSIKVNDIISK